MEDLHSVENYFLNTFSRYCLKHYRHISEKTPFLFSRSSHLMDKSNIDNKQQINHVIFEDGCVNGREKTGCLSSSREPSTSGTRPLGVISDTEGTRSAALKSFKIKSDRGDASFFTVCWCLCLFPAVTIPTQQFRCTKEKGRKDPDESITLPLVFNIRLSLNPLV